MKKSILLFAFVALGTSAEGSTLFFSTSGSSPTDVKPASAPAGSNAVALVLPGSNFSLYLWYDPDQQSGSTSPANLVFAGLGHDFRVGSTGVIDLGTSSTSLSYLVDNPTIAGNARWGSVNKGGNSATLLVDNANFAKILGSNLGTSSAADPFYDPTTDTYRVAELKLNAIGAYGTQTQLFIGIGSLGISFSGGPPSSTTINLGWGDAAIAGNDSRRSTSTAISALFDASVAVVPEPGSFSLLALGLSAVLLCRRARTRRFV